jgi:methylated-DNA-[protein]-cysteine S-methyltransferase
MLRVAASRLPARRNPERLAEDALSRGADRFFACCSPIGEVYVGVGPKGVRLVRRGGSPEDFVKSYRRRFKRLLIEGKNEKTRRLAKRVAAALAGERVEIPVDLSETTPFQQRVLEVVKRIPRGEVRPYAWVAREVGSSKAFRAVGNVMANNPVPLLIPCHRVVKNDGTVGSYAFGASEKEKLLRLEGVATGELAGKPYVATPTTGIVCHATCRNARRIRPENRRPFRSADEAVRAGYRPCRVCRPVLGAVADLSTT